MRFSKEEKEHAGMPGIGSPIEIDPISRIDYDSFVMLTLFHPLVARWFEERIGRPTDLQQQAWPKIALGEHLLVTAPTGSGKTLAAFLWSLNQLITGRWPAGHTSVLYVSPLRALNNDIQRNLIGPLTELREYFGKEGEGFPDIRVLTRSGDTPQTDRRQMLRCPPEILITTPESLNLLLSSKGGRSILDRLSTVILDEIHAVCGTKRGTYLITAVDRLVRLSGEFQRISLSATIRPIEAVAEFVGGFEMDGDSGNPRYVPRSVSIVSSDIKKKYELRVSFPRGEDPEESVWDPLVRELKSVVSRNRSTLIFVNSRRLSEMLTLMINRDEEEPVAYAHHGSLSLEIRKEVERRLKEGRLRAIVATHSLELGIDIGALDEVVLVQSPFSISSSVQRVGRSGHQVNQASRGTLLPTHSKDLLESAVLVPAILNHDIESFKAIWSPLDVLAQVIVSMVGVEIWDIDNLFAHLRASHPYRRLSREQFELVLEMLAGRYAETRIRELRPLVSIDRTDHTVMGRRGALQTLYLSGGVIPDRGYFHLRHRETKARIGELDEEFVWEAAVGDTFSLGTQNWRIEGITHNDVLVLPGSPKAAAAPFWKGEESGRDFHFSERIGEFLEEADMRLEDPEFAKSLEKRHWMDSHAARELIEFLKSQKESTGCPLPHRHHVVLENLSAGPGGTPQLVIHALWGGRLNRPFAMALDAAWEERFGHRLELYVSNDSVIVQLPHGITGEELWSMVGSMRLEPLLRKRLEGSGFFGARFRECAGRALLLPKGRFSQRMPLWLSRLRSQKLLEAVKGYEDFPILLETWRTCIQDEFDLEHLKHVLTELERGIIRWTEVHTPHPSPFAQGEGWRQVNQYMYMDDSPRSDKISRLRESLLREVVFTPGLRPTVTQETVERFEMKRKRLTPGYSPQTPRELLDWVVERVAIPEGEWKELLEAIQRDHGMDPEVLLSPVEERLVSLHPIGASEPLISAQEDLSRIIPFFYPQGSVQIRSLDDEPLAQERSKASHEIEETEEPASLLGQWLQFYGPMTVDSLQKRLGIEGERFRVLLEDLLDSQKIIQGQLTQQGGSEEVCDSENFEILLRMARIEAVPSFEPLAIEWLPLFLADHQGILKPKEGIEGLYESIEQLLCYPAEAAVWESEIFPARVGAYDPSWLDSLMQENELLWVGSESRRITFCFESDLDLLLEESSREETNDAESTPHSGGPPELLSSGGGYDFPALLQMTMTHENDLAGKLWEEVWRGKITNDTFVALRRAILNRFKIPARVESSRALRHQRRRRPESREASFFPGRWHAIPRPDIPEDVLQTEERRKDRVRVLLDRYGVLFRELLQREWPDLRWANIFRALRIMELSGEVISGIFFHGIPGPQFISHKAFRRLNQKLPEDTIYWINAADPASLCGVQVEGIHGMLPSRIATTHLVFKGRELRLISKRMGKDLLFRVRHDDPELSNYFIFLNHLLNRKFQPLRRIVIETINDERATESPYVNALRRAFDVSVDPREVVLYRKMRP